MSTEHNRSQQSKNGKEFQTKSCYINPNPGDEIVISGIAGKFPDSDNVYQFRDNLFNKVDLVTDDFRRWKPLYPEVPQRTGKLNDIDKFDTGFFGITKVQSDNMDPMIRITLEKVLEAMVDAGYHPQDFENTNTGTFVGSNFSETENKTFFREQENNGDAITGTERSMLAKRINYFYKLNGPSWVTDAACASSMYALVNAYRCLNEGLCDKAIVCGVQLCLNIHVNRQFARLGVLSPDGSCKAFDNTGNGYTRSEAAVVLILEKSKSAKRIYAEIIHAKNNCDGYKEEGITFPSSEMQTLLMKEFYDEVQIDPTTLTYIEAHATGTKAGDPAELATIDKIFCNGRELPLHIGSIKSNIGHTEPASAICSIVKVLIAMESGFIPPNLHYNEPIKGIEALEKGRLLVVTEKMPCPDQTGLVAVNSFGFGGANAHLLLKWNQKLKTNHGDAKDCLPRLICVSGRTEYALEHILNDINSRQFDAEFIKLIHQVFRKSFLNHMFRGYSIITKQKEITRATLKLTSYPSKLCVIFTNFDERWFKLGEELMSIAIFAEIIQRIDDVLHQKLSLNISSILIAGNAESTSYIEQVLGTVSVQLGVLHILKQLNIHIDLAIGIGYGELLCGYLDGFLNLEQVILSAYQIAVDLQKNLIIFPSDKLKEILPERIHKPNAWIPIYSSNQLDEFGSADYLINNISKPLSAENCQKYIKSDDLVLRIGSSNQQSTENHVVLLDSYRKDTIINLLDSLGMIYLKGVDMNLDNLYPQIDFPVSRGTPMLSPLIKWDHTKNYAVYKYKIEGGKTSGQTTEVTAKVEEWEFVTGHVIDGRNLFPATGYLRLVWESYAEMLGKLMFQVNIVFEDVKFVRAANVPAEDSMLLTVMIQSGDKYFEVSENDATLVSGKIYELDQNHTFADFTYPVIENDEITMETKDVYKELKLRGYHYSNQFRGIRKCNLDRSNAIISWNGNWITFMDNMLQIQILQDDSRNLYVPTSIQRLLIDVPRHVKSAERYQNEIPVACHKNLSLISGGGIEICGLGVSSIPRRKSEEPILETCKFIPYEAQLSTQDAVRCLVQIILENANVIKVKAVEMDADQLLMPLVQQTLADLPLIQSELIVLSNKQLDMPGIQVEDKPLTTKTDSLVIMATDILSNNELLESALTVIRESSGYMISYQPINTKVSPPGRVRIMATYGINEGTLMLLQEEKEYVDKRPMRISSSLDNLSWIQPLKNLIKSNQKILLYCQSSEPEGLLGLVNCLRREPNGFNISAVILLTEAPPFDVAHEFYKKQLDKNIAINVWYNGRWGSYRHLLLPPINKQLAESEHCYVNVTRRGDLSSLKWIEGPLNKKACFGPQSELVDIYYAAINFRDVMTASGKIQADVITKNRVLQECVQGIEFSGRDSSGSRVMGMVNSGALSTMITADKDLLWAVPPQWSLEDAATVPVVYATVIYALLMRGGMKKGQSILIHSGTGGVGQAAINVATHYGFVIFTTVGTPEKKDFIINNFPQIEEEHIGDSRSTSFEQMVMKYTNGKGVDFVLNSLAEEKLQASIRCLAHNGTFLEIGKFDLANNNNIALSLLEKQATFQGIMLDQIFAGTRDKKEILADALIEGVRNGSVKPLMRTTFSDDNIEKAFRYMAKGKHMGKVLIKIRDEEACTAPYTVPRTVFKGLPRFYCNPNSTYIILGGLGGFGLELADWLVVRGAKKLILTSRSGVKTGYQALKLNIFKSFGATVIIRSDDVATKTGCEDLLEAAEDLGPVDGIFNLAVVLQDALFENQTEETFKTSLAPKAIITRNLDAISRIVCPNLRYFVVFSSVSCGRGNAGQTNYGMANSVMERVCELRKKDGYPALAIQWGAIGEVGLVAEMQENHNELVIGGTLQQRISNCLQIMDTLLRQDETVVASMVVAEKKEGTAPNNILDVVLNIIGITNVKTVSIHATLPELGMDSMMAVEIKQMLEREYEMFVTAQYIRNMTIAKLKEMVTESGEVGGTKQQDNLIDPMPENIQLFFTHIGDEQSANIPLINFKTAIAHNTKAPVVFGLPGIEGMAAIFQPVAEHLKFHFSCLQLCPSNQADTIEELAKSLVKVIESTPGDFTIIAYSFGCAVATELMYLLECSGKTGKALFIDGAPELTAKLTKLYFQEKSDDNYQMSLLFLLMSKYIPTREIQEHTIAIMKLGTFEDKVRYVLKTSPSDDRNENYIIEMCKTYVNRIKAISNYQTNDRILKSVIMLVKPTQQSIVKIADDYNLSSICERDVRVHVIDGNHSNILENPKLVEVIEEFMEIDCNEGINGKV